MSGNVERRIAQIQVSGFRSVLSTTEAWIVGKQELINGSCPRMAVRKTEHPFLSSYSARNHRSFDWFVIGEKENRERSPAETRLCRILLYEIKMCP